MKVCIHVRRYSHRLAGTLASYHESQFTSALALHDENARNFRCNAPNDPGFVLALHCHDLPLSVHYSLNHLHSIHAHTHIDRMP